MKKLTIYTKGNTKGDLGLAAIGVRAVDENGEVVLEVAELIGNATKEYAEYFSVVRAFQLLQEKLCDDTNKMQFELCQENETIDNHLKACEQIKDVSLIGHFIEIYNLRVSNFPNLILTLVSEEKNKEASQLVKNILDA